MTTATPAASLSPRELQVLEHLAQGATYHAIARRLQLSPHTVDTYLRRIRAKTGPANRTQLALLALALEQHPRTVRAAPVGPAPTAHDPTATGREPRLRHPLKVAEEAGSDNAAEAGSTEPPLWRLPPQAPTRAPDPAAATTPQEFVQQLRLLKAWSGEPSFRQLERTTGLPRSTLAQALDSRQDRLPPLDRIVAIVRALGTPAGTAQLWVDAWKKIQMLRCLPSPVARSGLTSRSGGQ